MGTKRDRKERDSGGSDSSSSSSSSSSEESSSTKHHKHKHKHHHKKHHHKQKHEKKKKPGRVAEKIDDEQSLQLTLKRDEILTQLQEDTTQKLPKSEAPSEFLKMEDYYRKNREFMLWFHEATGKHFSSFQKTEESMEQFFTFAKLWNARKLPAKFYDEKAPVDIDPAIRTAYKWKFTEKVDSLELASARDAVDTDTNSRQWQQLPRERWRRRQNKEGQPESDRDRERRERN